MLKPEEIVVFAERLIAIQDIQQSDINDAADLLVRAATELQTRNRHLARLQAMLDRLETRMSLKDDTLPDERYLKTTEIRQVLLGQRNGP